MKFIMKKNYEDLAGKFFFTPLEILHGRAMCDISLTDHHRIKEALRSELAAE